MVNRSPGTQEYLDNQKLKRMAEQQRAAEASQRCLQQMIDEKRQEAAQKEEKRKAALKAKVDRQIKERGK